MTIFVALLFVLGIVAVIGHGVWVLVAAFFRAIFGASGTQQSESPVRCAECGYPCDIANQVCAACAQKRQKPDRSPLAQLATAARQMDAFLNQGKLDLETHRRVMDVIDRERERLTAPAAPQPVITPKPKPANLPKPIAPPTPAHGNQRREPNRAKAEPSLVTASTSSPVEKVLAHEPTPAPLRPLAAPEPRRSLTEMLETFMEESSIRWGELIGGMLIIGCSLALVISLWSQIKGQPLLKFSVFVGMTAGLFGLGFYSAHRWRLPTTSRGVLVISTLLVPMNFLAMTAFSHTAAMSPAIIGGEMLALLLFSFLVYQAGKVVASGSSGWLTVGALAPSLAMLAAKHAPGTTLAPLALLLIPIASYWAVTGWLATGAMPRNAEQDGLQDIVPGRLLTLFGIASFASLMPLALLIAKSSNVAQALHTFAPLFPLFGIPAIATGLTLRRTPSKLSGQANIAATSIALLGAMLAAGGLGLAWPRPLAVITVAMIDCAVCALITWRFGLKLAHAAAIIFFAVAWLIGANIAAGNFPVWSEDGARLASTFFSRTSGLAWMSLFVLFGAAAETWRRFSRRGQARLYEFVAVVSAFFSLVLLTWRGFGRMGDPQHLALVYGVYAVAAFAIAWYRNSSLAGWVGICLLLPAMVQAFSYRFGYSLALYHPARLSLLVYATIATIAAAAAQRAGEKVQRIFGRPLTYGALFSSVAVAPFLLFGGWMSVGQMAARLLWLSGIWFALSLMKSWPRLFTAAQSALFIGVVSAVAATFDSRALPSHSYWLDPHLIQAEGIALALLCLTWVLLRISVREDGWARLLSPSWPAVDRVVLTGVWLLLIWTCLGGVTGGAVLSLIPGEHAYVTSSEFAQRSVGWGSWLLLLSLLIVFTVSLWEEFRRRTVIGLMTLGAAACLLLSANWQAAIGLLSSLRWLLAAGFALGALPILFRVPLRRQCARFAWPRFEENATGLAGDARTASIVMFALPVLALTSLSLALRLLAGDIPSLSEITLFVTPLLLLSLTLAAYGVRERSSSYAFAAGIMLNLAVTTGAVLGRAEVLSLIQANLITSAAVCLLWTLMSRWLAARDAEGSLQRNRILRAQTGVTLVAALALLAVADARLWADPSTPSQMAAAMGGVLGWLSVGLPALAFATLRDWRFDRRRVDWLGMALVAVSSLAACSVSRAASGWAAYHALLVGVAACAWVMLALVLKRNGLFKRFAPDGTDSGVVWVSALGFAQLLFTIREFEARPDVWWTSGSLAALCLLFTALAIATRRRIYVYFSGLFCNLAVTRLAVWIAPGAGDLLSLLLINVISLCLYSLVWLKLDLAVMRQSSLSKIAPFHRVAARISLAAIVAVTTIDWLSNLLGEPFNVRFEWAALCALIALLAGCLWDDETDVSWRGLYLTGALLMASALTSIRLSHNSLLAGTAVAFSLYALAGTLLWRSRERLVQMATTLRIPLSRGVAGKAWLWLVWGAGLFAAFVMSCSAVIVFDSGSLGLRLLTTTMAFAVVPAISLLALGAWRARLMSASVRLYLLCVLFWSWAWLTPGVNGRAINRLVIVMLIAEAVLIAYRLAAATRLSPASGWRKSWRDDLWWVSVVGLASLALVMGVEISNYATLGASMIGGPVILAVLVTLLGLCLIGLAFALLPGEDPFGLDERGRMRYVYAVEGFIVLALMHVRVTMPWVFGGRFTAYWPLLILALAFAGVGLSEVFRRRNTQVLAEPLERTGALLPLLPVIGFWVAGSQIPYSLLLVLVGLFYGWLSVIRRSFGFGLLAALAGNGGLWYFLRGEPGYAFSEHPQLWLIPAALSVLLAARITSRDGRDSVSPEQLSSIRYGAMMTIYVSSTADIFLNGVEDSPWLPIVLAVLSVAGVAAGLMLRIRSFLFLGAAFLLLSMLTMIWSASVNLHWAWLWWVTGIALGVFILYTFAMFERKREEMLRFVERMKQWQ